jgi:hypothetical protein
MLNDRVSISVKGCGVHLALCVGDKVAGVLSK